MLTLTDRAATVLKDACAGNSLGLRIAVDTSGCDGLQYQLALQPEGWDTDDTLELSGIRVFVDRPSTLWLTGVTVDYVEDEDGTGFVFDNPNAGAKCACSGGCG